MPPLWRLVDAHFTPEFLDDLFLGVMDLLGCTECYSAL